MNVHRLSIIFFIATFCLLPLTTGAVVATDTQAQTTQQPSSTETIGYWDGVWYNDTFSFDGTNEHLDKSDRDKLVKRTIARVEVLRNDTFETRPPLNIIPREEYQRNSAGYPAREGAAKEWNNLVWQSLFVVDSDTNVEQELQTLYGGQVRAFYSPSEEAMYVIVAQSQRDLVKFDSTSVAHELTHAYQHQRFDLLSSKFSRQTQDGSLAKDSLLEGEAMYIETKYQERCSSREWTCYQPTQGESTTSQANLNIGLQLTSYFPYSGGHNYVNEKVETNGWSAIEKEYTAVPTSTTEIIHKSQPASDYEALEIEDTSSSKWKRYNMGVNGTEDPGETSLFVMLWYQNHKYSIDAGVDSSYISDTTDVAPYTYSHPITNGITGAAITPYYHRMENKTGYMFKTTWATTGDQTAFQQAYIATLEGHGATEINTTLDGQVYRISNESGYSGVYYVEPSNNTLTVTYASSFESVKQIRGVTAEGDFADSKTSLRTYFNSLPLPTLIGAALGFVLIISYAVKLVVVERIRKI